MYPEFLLLFSFSLGNNFRPLQVSPDPDLLQPGSHHPNHVAQVSWVSPLTVWGPTTSQPPSLPILERSRSPVLSACGTTAGHRHPVCGLASSLEQTQVAADPNTLWASMGTPRGM